MDVEVIQKQTPPFGRCRGEESALKEIACHRSGGRNRPQVVRYSGAFRFPRVDLKSQLQGNGKGAQTIVAVVDSADNPRSENVFTGQIIANTEVR